MSLELEIKHVPIGELRVDPGKPRHIEVQRLDQLTRSVAEFKVVQPILARLEDRTVIAGHQRLVVARRLGHTTVPVIWLDLSINRAQILGMALNNEYGVWDEALLARRLTELNASPDLNLALAGFDERDLTDLLQKFMASEKRRKPETFDLDAALAEATREPRAKRGEVWKLGAHRLECGDATDLADVRRLAGDGPVAMAFTDPPYNVNLGEHGGRQRGARRRAMVNDDLDPEAWDAFLRASVQNILALVAGAIYVCMSSKELPTLSRILAEEGGHWSDTIIWVKDRFVLGRADFQRRHESIWYGWAVGARRQPSLPRSSETPSHQEWVTR